MKRMLMILICCGTLGVAQEPAAGTAKTVQWGTTPTEKRPWLQKVIDVKYAEVIPLANLIGSLRPGGSPDRVSPQVDLHAISIGTFDPAFLQLAEEIIKRYDVAAQGQPAKQGHDIELVAYILVASPKGTAGDALPADLDGVAKQLRSLFGYRDLKLMDTALIRARDGHGGGDVSGDATGLVEGAKVPTFYDLAFQSAQVRAEAKGNAIELGHFRFRVLSTYESSPGKMSNREVVDFNTDLSIADSQKVVVGKSSVGSAEQALILVLSARVVN
jgi:hypothetical protein